MKNKNNFCVIMAGGVGSRFWPMSTQTYPKQFHDILGTGRTLIQQSFDRLAKIAPIENIFIITNKEYVQLCAEQLPELNKSQIIGEPMLMNTSACNMYMAEKIYHLNPDANLLVAPSDHIILDEATFVQKANMALEQAAQEEQILTLGIQPTRPDTGYGYIQFWDENNQTEIKKVKTFTEKPNREIAEQFLASGDFLWNSGIFIWSAKTIRNAFQKYLPDMFDSFAHINSYNTAQEDADIAQVYPTVQKLSIDYGILEKADNVFVIPSSFGWSDLGTWNSLFENSEKNKENNVIKGKRIFTYNASGNIVRTTSDKVIVIEGLQGYIVADTPKALLICPKDQDQKVKEYIQDIKLNKGEDFV